MTVLDFISSVWWQLELPYRRSCWTHRTFLPKVCLLNLWITLKDNLENINKKNNWQCCTCSSKKPLSKPGTKKRVSNGLVEVLCIMQDHLQRKHFCNDDKDRLAISRCRAQASPTPWSRVLLQKLVIIQLLKKLPAFYGTQRSITMLTRALFWPLSWSRLI